MKHCGTQELRTKRLLLRPLDIDDAEMMYGNWASDAAVTQYLRWSPHRNWGVSAEVLYEWSKRYAQPDFYQWGICDGRTGALFGSINISPAEVKTGWHVNIEHLGPAWEVGYAIGRKWWNRGYTTEALCAVRDYWFNTVGGGWLTACHANEHVASSAVLLKAGFVYDHDAVCRRFDGTKLSCRAYRLLKKNPTV